MTKRGRPTIGVTKKVSITLPGDDWQHIENVLHEIGISKSEYLRLLIKEEIETEKLIATITKLNR